MLFIIKHTIKIFEYSLAVKFRKLFLNPQSFGHQKLDTLENKKSENTRLQQSWNHNGNSRNTQEVFFFAV